MNQDQARAIQRLMAGGLHTGDEDDIRTKDAAIRVAAAQARAIRFALMVNNNSEMPPYEDGRQGWCAGDERFDRNDAFIALGGVVALLDAVHLCDEADRAVELLEEMQQGSQGPRRAAQ